MRPHTRQSALSLLHESILINRRGSLILILAYRAAYHTPEAVNQNIAPRTQDIPRHAKGKTNVLPRIQRFLQVKKHTAGRDVPRDGQSLFPASGKQHGEGKRKTHRAPNFLPGNGRWGVFMRERLIRYRGVHTLLPESLSGTHS